jgi:hypothetical protein
MEPRGIKKPTRAEALAFAESALSDMISHYLGQLMAKVTDANPNAKPPRKSPGAGLDWERVDDDFVAREAARLSAWKLGQMAELRRDLYGAV